jgi:hypothetical protein
MRRQCATIILRPETDIKVLPQGRVERCSLYLVAHSSPIASSELVKTSNQTFSALFRPESTAQKAAGAIISSAVGVKVLPPTLADHGLTNSPALNPREQTMTTQPP